MSYTIAQLKDLISIRENELSEAKVCFNSAACKKKSEYESYLSYLNSVIIPVLPEPEPYIKPTILDVINFLASNKASITNCTDSLVNFSFKSTSYKLELGEECIKLHTLDTYQPYKKLSDIELFITAEYIPQYIDPIAEIKKHNKKKELEINDFASSRQKIIRNEETKIVFHKKTSYYQNLKVNGLNGSQDISFWLRMMYLDVSTEEKKNTALEYLSLKFDLGVLDQSDFEYYKNLKCSISQIIDDTGFDKVEIKPILEDKNKISIPYVMKFFKSGINPDNYSISTLQCPKIIALGVILKNSDTTEVKNKNSDIASLIKIRLSGKNPIIHQIKQTKDGLESIPYRVYDSFSIHESCLSNKPVKLKNQVRMFDSKVINLARIETNQNTYINNKRFANNKNNELPTRVMISSMVLLESLSEFNNCGIYFENILHSYKKNTEGHIVLPEQLKLFLEKIKVGSKACLGKVILYKADKVHDIGILVKKSSKIFYFQLPKHIQEVRYKKVGTDLKVISSVDTRFNLNDKKELQQKIEISHKLAIKNVNLRLDVPELIKLEYSYDNYVLAYLNKHGIRDNLPLFTTRLNINWSKILNMKLEHNFIGENYSTPVTIK